VSSGGSGGHGGAGGAKCFSPLEGPPADCVGYPIGMVCGFGDTPSYSCTCTKKGASQDWDCHISGTGVSTSSGSGAGGAMCHGDATAWNAILAKPLSCMTNDQCCVVINTCLNDAQIVLATDYAAAGTAQPYCDNQCTNCLPPAIDVGCVGGKCVGQNLDNANPPPPNTLRQSHCGVNPVLMPAPTSHFTCGGP